MKRSTIAGTASVILLVPLALVFGYRALERQLGPRAAALPSSASSSAPSAGAPEDHPGFLYGRVTADGGLTYEGRLRFGIGQEAFWGDYFNGRKKENLWAAQVPAERLPTERHRVEILGIEVINRARPADLSRLVMARFGDIARIEPVGREVRVTLKSGTVLVLDRFEASDFDDDVRVWDAKGVVDLDTPAGARDRAPARGPGERRALATARYGAHAAG